MGANHGASGNKLQTTNEISIAVAANRVGWSAQSLEAPRPADSTERREVAGERFVNSVTVLAVAAFSEIDKYAIPEDKESLKASLVARLHEVLSTVESEITAQKLEAETQSLIDTMGIVPPLQVRHEYTSMSEEHIGQTALM